MALSAEELYLRLGQLIESMPDLTVYPLDQQTMLWLGRAMMLVQESEGPVSFDGGVIKGISDKLAKSQGVGNPFINQQVATILHRALARAEMRAPIAARGAFLAVNKPLDVFANLGKVMASARQCIRIVDPYLDENVVVEFVGLAPEGISVQLLAGRGEGRNAKPAFKPAVERFVAQFGNARPLEARATAPMLLHDRLIDIDGNESWIVTQSFNAIAKRSPASISRSPEEIAQAKIAYYADLWTRAEPV